MEARLTLLLLRQRGVALKTWAMARALTIEQRLRARGPGETTGRAVETVLIAAAGNGKVAVVAGDGGAAMMVAAWKGGAAVMVETVAAWKGGAAVMVETVEKAAGKVVAGERGAAVMAGEGGAARGMRGAYLRRTAPRSWRRSSERRART
jgi:hypothetical protein